MFTFKQFATIKQYTTEKQLETESGRVKIRTFATITRSRCQHFKSL